MNVRRANKIALMRASAQGREVYLARGLYEKTGSLAMATGLLRVKILADPRLFGEHRVIQEMIRLHEGAHIALGHTRLLAVAKLLSVLLTGGLLACAAAPIGSIPLVLAVAFAGAWCEAKWQFLTLPLRASAEAEADALALSAMKPHAFATAVKTLDQSRAKRSSWWGRIEEKALYGRSYVDRLARVGLSETPRG